MDFLASLFVVDHHLRRVLGRKWEIKIIETGLSCKGPDNNNCTVQPFRPIEMAFKRLQGAESECQKQETWLNLTDA
jgi:hypothetical protein